MNFVQLVEDLRVETAAGGSPITTLVGLNSTHDRLRNWVAKAWREVQLRHARWAFLRASTTHMVPQYGSLMYTNEYQTQTVAFYELDTMRMSKSTEGIDKSWQLSYMEWNDFQQSVLPTITQYATPQFFTVRPDQGIMIGPGADQNYTLYYDYYQIPQELLVDADVPICPPRFHDIIVFKAATFYGRYTNAQEILTNCETSYRRRLTDMERTQLERIYYGGWGCL